jgi:hypothetical protein
MAADEFDDMTFDQSFMLLPKPLGRHPLLLLFVYTLYPPAVQRLPRRRSSCHRDPPRATGISFSITGEDQRWTLLACKVARNNWPNRDSRPQEERSIRMAEVACTTLLM